MTLSPQLRRRALHAIMLAVAYFAAAAVSVRFTRFEGGVAFIWTAGGVLLGTLVVADRRRWLELGAACVLASAAATCLFGLGPVAAAPLTLANIFEALLGAWVLRRYCPACGELKSVGEISVFIASAGLAAPAASAFLGAGVASMVAGVPYWPNWIAWFSGHALGNVAVAPVMVLGLRGDMVGWVRSASARLRWEAVGLITALAVATIMVFSQSRLPLLFLPFLPMMAAVFRLGRLGAIASILLLGTIATVLTVHGLGPVSLIHGGSGLRSQFFQLYLATAVLMILPAAGDLKRRKRLMQELENQAALHRLILDRTGDAIMTLALDGRIRFASPSTERVLGLAPDQLVGTMPQTLIHPDDVQRVVAVQLQALEEPERTFTVEYRVVVAGNERGWFETHARATLDMAGRLSGAVVIVRDVTSRKEAERRLTTAALTDPLTGIANRRAFDDALSARLRSGEGSAMLAMFDLDHFKAVNDTHGHNVGDRVLVTFAAILRSSVRDCDMVARLGGEEFVAVINGDLDAARLACERVRSRIAEHETMLDTGCSVRVTVSTGLAPIPPSGSAVDVLAAADAALYRAKIDGRNRLACAE